MDDETLIAVALFAIGAWWWWTQGGGAQSFTFAPSFPADDGSTDSTTPPAQTGGPVIMSGGNLGAADIASAAANAGFVGTDLITAVAIALAESGGNPQAYGDLTLAPTKGPSRGLWQINVGSLEHPEYSALNLDDPATNAQCAYAIYRKAGARFTPWSTFNGKQYQTHLAVAQAGVLAALSVSNA